MSNVVQTILLLDTADADEKIDNLQKKVDKTVKIWGIKRQDIMRGLSIVTQAMNIINRLTEDTIDKAGQVMLKSLTSLLSVVTTTVSAMYAVAAGYTATGILAPIGIALAAFATGMGLGQAIAISIAQADIDNVMREARYNVSYAMPAETFRSIMGGGI